METKEQKQIKLLLKLEKSTRVVKNEGKWNQSIFWTLLDGKPHRDFGPAIESIDGTKYWCQNGNKHREDGPAVVFKDDYKPRQYWIDGKQITKEKFIKWQLKNKNK